MLRAAAAGDRDVSSEAQGRHDALLDGSKCGTVIVVSSVQQWPRLPDLRALLGRAVAALVACGCGGQHLSGAGGVGVCGRGRGPRLTDLRVLLGRAVAALVARGRGVSGDSGVGVGDGDFRERPLRRRTDQPHRQPELRAHRRCGRSSGPFLPLLARGESGRRQEVQRGGGARA